MVDGRLQSPVDITKDTTTLYASDAPADGRFLDTQSIRSLPKAPALSGSDEIPEMPQFETNVCSPRHNSNPLPKYW
ncbi:hypothetical protein CHELA40_12840 [Chelatococcus asaccharovorans]|nr:hypothetical protein CHELA40_12840 [Chelatococcus asaccharovorans]CAH1681497.1 hypothetical protein CHELA17_62779 [Chelatococcus asaccharovorans]